ncbi:MAG TPA: hypothetical protein VMB49_10905 [Acidobacteriaceae bacterium]|nr:hypothetical protein [Acidobacteriaceae bacterium]
MRCLVAIAIVGGFVSACAVPAQTRPQAAAILTTDGTPDTAGRPVLPSTPPGKTTVMGGEIRHIDVVRDEFILHVFGGHPVKILFDARTELYQDGRRIAAGDLRPAEHASVETLLDGTNVYAVSIHTLSRMPEGESQGQLVNYNPATRELTLSDQLSRQSLELMVPSGTPVVSHDHTVVSAPAGAARLAPGTLIAVQFQPDEHGRGIARQISILAAPGSAIQFRGTISFLDLHAGRLLLTDPSNDQSYEISFDRTVLPSSEQLRQGDEVSVNARFDGRRYVASGITVTKAL